MTPTRPLAAELPGAVSVAAADAVLHSAQKGQKSMEVFDFNMAGGISRTKEFEKKGLATHAVNVGTKCGHDCTYCSTGPMLRMHPSFTNAGRSPFDARYAIVDPTTPARVAHDARAKRKRGVVQLCTTVDAWAPEAQQHGLGRRCLEAILSQPRWQVRVLTKNAAVARDFDLIEKHRHRVTVGISLTAPASRQAVVGVLEPNASPVAARLEALEEAHQRGLRTYGMLCPLLPGVVDQDGVQELVDTVLRLGAEEVFVEPVNARGNNFTHTTTILRGAGFAKEAAAVDAIRSWGAWSSYVVWLLRAAQNALRAHGAIEKLRFLLYPARLTLTDKAAIEQDDSGVIWLGK